MDVRDTALRFTIFGPVRAWRDGVELDPGPPAQRALLAVLLAAAGNPVGLDEIVDVLWGNDPPASAVNVVHRHVGRLRRVFEPALPARAVGAWLLPSGRAYRLAVDADTADLPAFRQRREQARSALRSGDGGRAVALFGQALEVAAAPVAVGLEPRVREHPAFAALERERLDAICDAADAAVDEGAAASAQTVLPTLRRAAADHEFDEPLHARLMLVLAATGRQAEALATYVGVRRRLAAELGIDPGPELRDAQQRVLRQQTGPAGQTASGRPQLDLPSIRPAQLPPAPATFTGRRDELAAALRMTTDAAAKSRVAIGVIGGMAGIGKTTLAVQWAHQVADRFTGGQLYADLRGFDATQEPTPPTQAVRGFLEALGVAGPAVPADLDARTALYRTLLAGRRLLVLLDNARDSEQVRALLPGSPGCLVIVTSRNQLTGLVAGHGAEPVALHPMPVPDAHDLLARRLGPDRVAAEPAAVEAIVAACAGLPLALSIVAARAATNPTFTLSALAGQLWDSAGGLDALGGDDPAADARTVFSWSYGALSPGAARLFRLLAIHPGPEIALTAAASIAGLDVPAAGRRLRELTAASLLAEPSPGRYAVHDLLRSYATELLGEGSPADRREATGRLVDHYVHTARAAFRLSGRAAVADPEPARAGVTIERPPDLAAAVGWFIRERAALKAVVDLAASGPDRAAALLALDWRPMDYQINGALDMLPSVLTALRAAQQLQEPALLAELHRDAALRYSQLKDFPPAQEHLAAAVELFRQIGHRAAESHAQRNMALLYERQGRNAEMLAPAERAVTIARAAASGEALAVALATLGHVYMHLERHRDAIPVLEEALRLMTEIGITTNQTEALTSLSYAHLHVGEAGPAVAYSQRALDMQRALDDRRGQLSTLPDHGDALLAAGDFDGARIAWETFLAMVRDVRTPGGVPIRLPFDPQEVADQVRAKLAKLGEAASDQPAGRRHGIGTSPAPPPS